MLIKHLACQDYARTTEAMRTFTETRTPNCPDQIWLLSHPPVFTLGLAADPKHLLQAGDIPVIQSNRGGQVTYHGPGQLIIYLMLDIKKLQINLAQLVGKAEQCIIDYCRTFDLNAYADRKARGVYIDGAKIAALGFKIHKQYCYHGIAFNVRMDLSPYQRIHPCGYKNLPITQLSDWVADIELNTVEKAMPSILMRHF